MRNRLPQVLIARCPVYSSLSLCGVRPVKGQRLGFRYRSACLLGTLFGSSAWRAGWVDTGLFKFATRNKDLEFAFAALSKNGNVSSDKEILLELILDLTSSVQAAQSLPLV
jgi:hypothetical protein